MRIKDLITDDKDNVFALDLEKQEYIHERLHNGLNAMPKKMGTIHDFLIVLRDEIGDVDLEPNEIAYFCLVVGRSIEKLMVISNNERYNELNTN